MGDAVCRTCGKPIVPREGLDGRRDGWTHKGLSPEEWKAMAKKPHTPAKA